MRGVVFVLEIAIALIIVLPFAVHVACSKRASLRSCGPEGGAEISWWIGSESLIIFGISAKVTRSE